MFKTICLSSLFICNRLPIFCQCTIPNGAVKLETGAGAAVDFAGVSNVNKTYYVPSGTTVTVNHSGAISIANSGTILVLDNAVLNINMGASNFTVGGGTIQLCQGAKMNINPGHDFTLQNNSNITLATYSHFNLCNFGHDVTFNGGTITMSDYSSFELSDYHNFVISSANIVTYFGAGTTSVGLGNPIVHTTGDDFVNYSNTNAFSQNLTASNHIDFVNDAHGGDKPGNANYCGPMAKTNNLACRSQWSGMNFQCGGAANYQDMFLVLPVNLVSFSARSTGPDVGIGWVVANKNTISYFQVEELKNNQPELLKEVSAKNSNADFEDYTVELTGVDAGLHYYRLKIVDQQGRIAYSQIQKVVSLASKRQLEVVYNSDRDELVVYTKDHLQSSLVVRVYDLGGRQLFDQQFHIMSDDAQIKILLNDLTGKMKIVTVGYGQQFKKILISRTN